MNPRNKLLNLRPLKILVTGSTGFVGQHLVAALKARGCEQVRPLGLHRQVDSTLRVNLMHLGGTVAAFDGADVVFHLAALCGGIGANMTSPADFMFHNLQMGMNVINGARIARVKKLVMLGTLCAFPRDINRPIEPEDLWSGRPEKTNAGYGIAKRTLCELGKAFHAQYGLNVVNVMPTNLFGIGDNFNLASSHVIPAMITRFTEARDAELPEVTCWGCGKATRDFLYVTDAVEGIILAAERIDDPDPICLGTGEGVTMLNLAEMIALAVGYGGKINWDKTKPDGQPFRVVGTRTQIEKLEFVPKVSLRDGLIATVKSRYP